MCTVWGVIGPCFGGLRTICAMRDNKLTPHRGNIRQKRPCGGVFKEPKRGNGSGDSGIIASSSKGALRCKGEPWHYPFFFLHCTVLLHSALHIRLQLHWQSHSPLLPPYPHLLWILFFILLVKREMCSPSGLISWSLKGMVANPFELHSKWQELLVREFRLTTHTSWLDLSSHWSHQWVDFLVLFLVHTGGKILALIRMG